MADNPETGPASQVSSGGDNPDLAAARAELERVKAEKQQIAQNYQQLRSAYNQRDNEVRNWKQRVEATQTSVPSFSDSDDSSAAYQRQVAQLQERIANQNLALGVALFRTEHPDWRDHWDEIQTIINDPLEAGRVRTFDESGQVDANRSLENAYREVRLRRLSKAEADMAGAREKKAQELERQKAQATISGVSAAAGEETIDVSKLTSDEMLAQGLVEFDPRDPIKPLRPGKR